MLDGFTLEQCASDQRPAKESVSSERKQTLDNIGFIWDALKDKT
jgi:hypothetical protein